LGCRWGSFLGCHFERLRRSYEMSDTAIYSRREGEILKIDRDGNIPTIEDEIALALLILNHHYWNGTGPFLIRDAISQKNAELRANEAFRLQDYETVIQELEPFSDNLGPVSAKKLKYAMKRQSSNKP
jgi:hypothetical protein